MSSAPDSEALAAVRRSIGRPRYTQSAQRVLDVAAVEAIAAATAFPGAGSVGVAAPLSAWSILMRSCVEPNPLQLHFDVKSALGYEFALITENRVVADAGPAVGGRYRHQQVLRSVGAESERSVGIGRSWRIDVEYLDAGGTVVAVESYEALGYSRRAANGDVR
ncbi:MAG: hypothetical protein GX868_18250 [Actinobacteria bacterium]|nr:hypothetical protein [Actinomycetota bacterium]